MHTAVLSKYKTAARSHAFQKKQTPTPSAHAALESAAVILCTDIYPIPNAKSNLRSCLSQVFHKGSQKYTASPFSNMRSICPATQTFHDKPKECPSLDETIAASLRGPPSHITMANSKSFNVALRLILQGFSKPHDRRIIAFQGPKVATDTITKELLSSIALSASIDSNRVYCIETAVLHTETCAFQRCQELASKNGNLVMVVLANTNQDELVSILTVYRVQ